MPQILLSLLILISALAARGEAESETESDSVLIHRPDGRFMDFKFEDGKAFVRFFDSDKKLIDPDVDRVSIRIRRRQPKNEFIVIMAVPFEGLTGLSAPNFVRAPLIFQVNLVLLQDDIEEPIEVYVFRYPDAMTAAERIEIFEGDPDEGDPFRGYQFNPGARPYN